MRGAAILLILQLMQPRAFGQQPDVSRYDITVRPDFRSGRLDVTAVVTLEHVAAATKYSFALNPRFDSVEAAITGVPARFERDERTLTVELPAATSLNVTIRASGLLGRSEDENRSCVGLNDLFLLWSDVWYPAAQGDWATARFTIVLPPAFKVIAPGRRVSLQTRNGTSTHIFESTTPMATFSVFADTRWTTFQRTVRDIPITLQLQPQVAKYADTLFTSSADVISYFTQLHGLYPYQDFSFITQDSIFARRAYSGFIGYESAWLERELARTGYDAHETSLLWWGGITRGRGRGAWQWTEGFGDYVEVLYAEARGLPLPANFERFRSQFLALPDSEDVVITGLNGSTPQKIVHGKYPWLMHLLRYRIGDDAFRRGIRLLFQRYRFRNFTLDEFVQAFAEAAGTSLDWWRTEWLERRGVPDLEYSYQYGDGELTGEVRQRASLYHLPIELGVYSTGQLSVHRLELGERVTPFRVSLAERPDSVRLDPRKWVLARIRRPARAGE